MQRYHTKQSYHIESNFAVLQNALRVSDHSIPPLRLSVSQEDSVKPSLSTRLWPLPTKADVSRALLLCALRLCQ